ncbi:wxL domain surface protein (plasmid) [Enterococcus mundtii QU 25]|uniref:WxL domain-containing protein n=1 Tax=Enterococcus mundtii TaxID=53346 RepID=UPI0003C5706F|nr:WxL domain-containing protein [Enterococcus mundtii]BAO08471.1 wxL domain surface protein [Enterococcus mundtii QU 25]
MTMTWRKTKVLLSVTLVVLHVLFLPVSMIYAETVEAPTHETEEDLEPLELPRIKNFLEEGEIREPRFFFTQSRMQGMIEEPIKVTFFSDQEVSEARVTLPNEAKLLKEQLPAGLTAKQGAHSHEWIIQTGRVRNTFVLPVVFDSIGNYEVAVENVAATIEVQEQEETSGEVPVEETEPSDENFVGQEELKEENGIEGGQVNEQPTEEVREPVVEAPQEQQIDAESEVIEPTVFDGKTEEVTTMAQFRAAVANPDIGIISVQANLTEATANVLTVDRPLLIQGNGYTLTFGINGFYFQLAEVVEPSAFRIENTRLTKVGITPLINATVESSKNWTVELENITEMNANTMRLASLPEGNIHFTGGVSNFTRTTSAQTFIVAKEVLATNQAEVTISRGNATVLFSSAAVADPKMTVEQGATVTITTTAGTANTIDLRGENPEIALQNGDLSVSTIGPPSTTTPTNTTNNAVVLSGTFPKITVHQDSLFTVRTTLTKRGIHLVGDNAQLEVNNSNLCVVSATQVALNIAGESPKLVLDSSNINITSTTGQRINLIGANPLLSLDSTEMIMNASTGRGIYLQGATPQVLMDNSQLLMTDTDGSRGMTLEGIDALLSLSNESELSITGARTGTTENILIGSNNARPELSVTGGSILSVTTTSGTDAATDTTNNAIHLRGSNPKAVFDDSELNIKVLSGGRRGLFLNGISSDLRILDSKFDIETLSDTGLRTLGNNGTNLISNSQIDLLSGTSVAIGFTGDSMKTSVTNNSKIDSDQGMYFAGQEVSIENNSEIEINSTLTASMISISDRRDDSGVIYFERRGSSDGQFTVNNSKISIDKKDVRENGITFGAPLSMVGGNIELLVENGGNLTLLNEGDGTPNDSTISNRNAGIGFRNYNGSGHPIISNNNLIVRDPGSRIDIQAKYGAAVTMSTANTVFNGSVTVENHGYFVATGNTASNTSGVFVGRNVNITFDNPLYLDFTNYRTGGGQVFGVSDANSTFTGINSDLALWENNSDLSGDPLLNFRKLDYSFRGINYNTLVSSSDPDQLNTDTLGTTGLLPYTRISSNNGRWAIADELRVPTNADKKIHGRVSLPVGLDDSRPAWDDEAIVTVEVESPLGENTQEYTAKTVGNTNESPGISIYGEEPRGGLFEIDLDEPLEAGSKVRISKVELTNGELTDGFEHQILTDTVEVFPIIPPTPAQFSSSIIAQDSTTIQGMTDNLDAEVTATHNGEPLNTENVTIDTNGRFTLDLSEVSLEMDDEIQVYLRDAEGSAIAAGVVNPPDTNNTRGNINPAAELTFHDVTFEPATTLIVGDVGPVSPVDPLDPEIEVDPENKPELPEDQGVFSIDFVSQFDFGSQVISAHDQTYYAQPQRLLNEDGTVNETEERPNYVQVSDRRPEPDRDGWELSVRQNEQFHTETGAELVGARLILQNQQLATAQGGIEPGLQHTNPMVLNPGGAKRTLLKAQGTEGVGTWIYRFGNADSAAQSVALEVPKGATPSAESYMTTLTWELSSVPNN